MKFDNVVIIIYNTDNTILIIIKIINKFIL